MKNLSATSKRILLLTAVACLVLFGVLCAVLRTDFLRIAAGIIWGYLCCVIRVILIERSIEKNLGMSQSDAVLYSRGQFVIRYILAGVFLITAALQPQIFNLWGAIVGVISLQFGAYAERFVFDRKSNQPNDKEVK
ncbi:MAG: hypothetical protein LBM16_00160 [Clostridiales bacterium]|jgi:hypothetical protein|nr:hypothetical protein [Clostridiales bacterium]